MTLYDQIARNKRNSILLMFFFVLIILGLGWVIDELTGMAGGGIFIAFVFAIFSTFFGYYFSDKMVLRISGAREVDLSSDRELFHLMENLTIATGLPMPRLYVIDDPSPNAFATGRNPENGVICVTTGLLEKLDKREIEGVLAHELAHIQNYDIRMMTLVVVFAGVIALLSDMVLRWTIWGGIGGDRRDSSKGGGQAQVIMLVIGIAFAILAPLVATVVRLAISRQREYLADSTAAMITRYPEGLAQALEKIALDHTPMARANKATAHMFIMNPLRDSKSWLNGLFATHPPAEERIRRLRGM